jgi:hypothetical protein
LSNYGGNGEFLLVNFPERNAAYAVCVALNCTMHTERITFDRVFDVQRRGATRYAPQRTDFSFEASGNNRYSVQVSGWPRIEAGDTVTAVLGHEGNWQTLAGWKNHANGEVVAPLIGRSIAGAWQGLFVGTLFLISFTTAETPTGRVAAGCVSAFAFAMAVVLLLQWRRKKLQAEAIQRVV